MSDWFYVFLMPNGSMFARHESEPILREEADALDCWIVEAGDKTVAIDRQVLDLYHHIQELQAKGYR